MAEDVVGEAWDDVDTCVGEPGTDKYDILYAREFSYDGARQRYLNRALNPTRLEDGVIEGISGQEFWSDYDGDSVYGDFTVSGGLATPVADYEPGVGRSFSPGVASATRYYHQDMLGSSRMMTNAAQSQLDRQWYSAFGESGDPNSSQRYGYAGAHGYQTDSSADGFPFMHVGARFYDPATGRFLQRDPIGIRGGRNVYEYVESAPTVFVDPMGFGIIGDIIDVISKIVEDMTGHSSPASAARGPIDVTARAMECGPDIARITIAKKHRDKLIDDQGDLMDALDRFDEGRNRHVKPGSGPAG